MKAGEYYLQGVMEVGSGFRFNEDQTFDFFYSYGAMDRAARGTWEQKGDQLILHSPLKPAKDFVMVQSKHVKGNGITVQVSNPNAMVLRNIYCQVETTTNDTLQSQSNAQGRISFEQGQPKTISLIHGFWPDRFSVFEVSNPADNYFEFTILPSIADVEFNNLILKMEDNMLLGTHPLIPDRECHFVKAE